MHFVPGALFVPFAQIFGCLRSAHIFIYSTSIDTTKDDFDSQLQVEIKKALNTSKEKFGLMTWNKMFHTILDECDLSSLLELDKFPKSYQPVGGVCGHSLQVDLDHVRYNTIRLTLLDLINDGIDQFSDYMDFIDAALFNNPIWDIGLQHELMSKNTQKIYIGNIKNYTSQCICPCSNIFVPWHMRLGIHKYTNLNPCNKIVYDGYINFVKHVHEKQDNHFHKIILRIIQTSYSVLLNKLNLRGDTDVISSKKRFQEICKENIKLPEYFDSKRSYRTHKVRR